MKTDKKVKTDKEALGHILGGISILPSFLLALYLIVRFNSPLFIIIVIFCQYFWLKGMDLIVAKYKEQLSKYQYLEEAISNRYIVTLCGSTRFKDEFFKVAEKLTIEGKIVLMPTIFSSSDNMKISDKLKKELKEIHKLKIDLSDSIYVINKDGYIGFDTLDEIEYAKYTKRKVEYLE